MSWMNLLYETYENLLKDENKTIVPKLLPICHSTQNAHIEITIDMDGEFITAQLVSKENAETVIPVTEASASRGSGIAPHPLCDKIQYMAGDYAKFGGEKGDKYFEAYVNQLEAWCKSSYTNNKVKALYKYIQKKSLIADLVESKILCVDEQNKVIDKWGSSDVKMSVGNPMESFIRFRVSGDENNISAIWQDKKVQEGYIGYYLSNQGKKHFCYVLGEEIPISINHPSKIRHSGDKAKLISSNDTSGFTYRGRFEEPEQAVSVSYEVSQKSHNALKWLIEKQGVRVGDKVFVLWSTSSEKVPGLIVDTVDFLDEDDQSDIYDTKEAIALQFNKAILGYKANLKSDTKLALIGLDAATTGRLAMIFYREYFGQQGNELIDNINRWHKECSWYHRYKFSDKKLIPFYGAPSPWDVANIAYGTEQNGFIKGDFKLVAKATERILPCICDGCRIPRDIVKLLVNKSNCPQNYTNENNWKKVVTITCSMYKKYLHDYEGVDIDMKVDEKCKDLDYNCGRLLAIADTIEAWALDEKRTTNAIRYFSRFAKNPCETWGIINDKLVVYREKLGGKGAYLYKLMGEVSSNINIDEFSKARNLDGKMVLGFDSQKQSIIDYSIEKKELTMKKVM